MSESLLSSERIELARETLIHGPPYAESSDPKALVVFDGLREMAEYAAHTSWRCEYRTRYGECHCGLDDLCDKLGIDRVPPNDPEAKG